MGFGRNPAEAGNRVLASLASGFARVKSEYIGEWQQWQGTLLGLGSTASPGPSSKATEAEPRDLYRLSAAMLRVHEDKSFPRRDDREPVDSLGIRQGG